MIEASPTWFPRWREVLHPSRPVTTPRQAHLVSHESRWRSHSQSSGGRRARCQRAEEHQQVEETEQESTSPTRPLETVQEVASPPGFQKVTACLWRDPLSVTAFKVPPEPLWLEAAIELAVATMWTSHIVQDEAMGMMYMDTINTSMGQVATHQGRRAQCQRAEGCQQVEETEQESTSLTGPLEMVQEVAPPQVSRKWWSAY